MEIRVLDVADLDPDGVMQEAERESAAPFDLATTPSWRALLMRVDRVDWILQLTLHHIIGDGTSIATIEHELSALYKAAVSDAPVPTPPPRQDPGALARQDRLRRESPKARSDLEYWAAALSGAPAISALPTDRIRSGRPSGAGGRVVCPFSASAPSELAD